MLTKLHLLKPGQLGQVVRISGEGTIKRRIIDMGIISGTEIKVQKFAPLGDPMEINLCLFNCLGMGGYVILAK
ncbi:MAG: ferrous iron transport protein A [Pelosinus sp.]|nr:ferrous iron transport protein A [Pelosinus sp.]